MTRIAGVDLPEDKRIDIGLTYLYGVGRTNVIKVLERANIEPTRRLKTLNDEEISRIAKVLEKDYMVEGDLRQQVAGNIKRLREIGTYRGIRHGHNLPSRGQRTRSNGRTRRGKRQTIGAMRKDDRQRMDTPKTPAAAPAAKAGAKK